MSPAGDPEVSPLEACIGAALGAAESAIRGDVLHVAALGLAVYAILRRRGVVEAVIAELIQRYAIRALGQPR